MIKHQVSQSTSMADLRSALKRNDRALAAELAVNILTNANIPKNDRSVAAVLPMLATLAGSSQEQFAVVGLRGGQIVCQSLVTTGLLNRTLVHPRELLFGPLKARADSIVMAHCHPSGDVEPSQNDLDATDRIRKCGELLNINLVEHYVIGATREGVDAYGILSESSQRIVDFAIVAEEAVARGNLSPQDSAVVVETFSQMKGHGDQERVKSPETALNALLKSGKVHSRQSDYYLVLDAQNRPCAIRDLPAALSEEDKIRYIGTVAIQALGASLVYVRGVDYYDDGHTDQLKGPLQHSMKTLGIDCVDYIWCDLNTTDRELSWYSPAALSGGKMTRPEGLGSSRAVGRFHGKERQGELGF